VTEQIALHRVLADWGEGASNAGSSGGGGAVATAGDATWLHRFFNGTTWAAPGGDHAPGASAQMSIGVEGFYALGSTAGTIADVQAWLDTPASNFGWLLKGNEAAASTTKRFDTREAVDPAWRPSLTVTYDRPTPARSTTWGRIRALWR
jgi:hypothetical protein